MESATFKGAEFVAIQQHSEMKCIFLSRYARVIIIAAALLAACRGTQPAMGVPGAMPQSAPSASHASRDEVLHGYYLAKFTTVVGSGLPFSSLCLKFAASGAWSSTDNGGLKGTYLISGRELFASAIGYWSPPVYMTLQGTVNAKHGSGDYIVNQTTGVIFSGGTFTMTGKQNKNCGLGKVKTSDKAA